jgi:vacuolar-type H+-ATPase subunit H
MIREAAMAVLAPVRAHMLRRANDRADQILSDARHEAAAILSQARLSAERAVSEAQGDGRTEGAKLAAKVRSRAREEVMSLLLTAEREMHEELCRTVRTAVAGLRDQPGYDQLLARITELARQAAGPGAVVAESPSGGVVARADGVLVDCSLPRLADRAVEELAGDIRALWAP